jgi:hypothetical protein
MSDITQINKKSAEGLIPDKSISKVVNFSKIRSWGDKNKATTFEGEVVERQELFYVEGYGMVKAVPYELHFIYEDPLSRDNNPKKRRGRWAYMCTCGSMGVVMSYKDIAGQMSPTLGEYILACKIHTDTKRSTGVGHHADNSTE